MSKEEFKIYRMLAARLNYMAQGNPMIQYPAKETCRSMAKPTVQYFLKIKRLVRFIQGLGPVTLENKWQTEEESRRITVM